MDAATRLRDVRIVVANNFAGPGLGGGEVQLLPVLAAWRAHGADVVVLAPEDSALLERAEALGARTHGIGFSTRTAVAAVGAIVAAAREGARPGATLLVGTGYFTGLLVRAARTRADARVINIVGVVPGASEHDGGSRAGAAVRRFADSATAGRVDVTVAVSDAVREALVAGGAASARVRVIPNGIDIAQLETRASQPFALPAGKPLIGCVARLEPVKGVEFLVRAVGQVPGVTLAVVGEGSQQGRLREVAVASGVSDRVHFLGGQGAAALLRAADVVVVPSLSEGFGLVAAEASALRRPVIASRVGGLPEVVEDGVTGVLVPPGDSAALAAAISDLLETPGRGNALGEAGRRRVETRFTSERMAAAYVDLVAELVGGARP